MELSKEIAAAAALKGINTESLIIKLLTVNYPDLSDEEAKSFKDFCILKNNDSDEICDYGEEIYLEWKS